MSNFERIDGDEEGIEQASDHFFTALDPHMKPNGELDLAAAEPDVQAIADMLSVELEFDEETIAAGLLYAAQVVNDKRQLMDYL